MLAALLAASLAAAAAAGGDERALELRISLKASGLVEREAFDPLPPADRTSGAGLWRLRLEGLGHPGPATTLEAAYEQRLRVESAGAASAAAGPLPLDAPPPYRLRPLDWPIARGTGLAWRHEVDRAAAALRLGPAQLTLGRQAVGWGRGVLFGAVDLFAPFAFLEVDREWRRGVDAARVELRLADRAGAELVVAGAEAAREMAAAGRLRGAAGDLDGEVVAGWRAGDWLLGLAASGALGGAELHGELAAFRAREALPAGGAFGDPRLAFKAVAGASRRLAVGNGLLLLGEYHHSGFGARSAGRLAALLADPGFQRRLLRGDLQIPGRHAAAASASYTFSPVTTASLTALVSPADGSGLLAPQIRLDLSDRVTAVASAVLPFGEAPRGLSLRSEYGATARAGFVQLAVYE
jgi:hypothetical protein